MELLFYKINIIFIEKKNFKLNKLFYFYGKSIYCVKNINIFFI